MGVAQFFFTGHHNSSTFICIWNFKLISYVVQELWVGTNRPTDRQTDRPTDRQTDRPTDIVDCRDSRRIQKPCHFQKSISGERLMIEKRLTTQIKEGRIYSYVKASILSPFRFYGHILMSEILIFPKIEHADLMNYIFLFVSTRLIKF